MSEVGGRLGEALEARRTKLKALRAGGVDPFALRYDPDASLTDVHARHDDLPSGEDTDVDVRVAGRIVLLRRHGKLSFATIRDAGGELQLFVAEDVAPGAYELLANLDLGDIVGASGIVMKTKRGELSVRVKELTLLTKALRPLPEKWVGLRDPEARLRHRYLEFASSLESRRIVQARATLLKSLRQVLDERGFVEVETPALQPVPGGAVARPFVTHHQALDIPLYLRIAPELYLKRLLVGGLERVYEIGRSFRNEGISAKYNPEFTMLEAYQAYGDYTDMMDLVEELVLQASMAVHGSPDVEYQGRRLALARPWRRARLDELVEEATRTPVHLDDVDGLRSVAGAERIHLEDGWPAGKILAELYEKLVEPNLFQPTWVMDLPREVSPLARSHRSTPGFTEHADLVIAGVEISPAYSELSDPDEQRARFDLQRAAKAAGDEEAHPYDEDFLEALEHGMPPAGGFGLGVDRLTVLLSDVPSIRDVILFPHVRPEGGRT